MTLLYHDSLDDSALSQHWQQSGWFSPKHSPFCKKTFVAPMTNHRETSGSTTAQPTAQLRQQHGSGSNTAQPIAQLRQQHCSGSNTAQAATLLRQQHSPSAVQAIKPDLAACAINWQLNFELQKAGNKSWQCLFVQDCLWIEIVGFLCSCIWLCLIYQ